MDYQVIGGFLVVFLLILFGFLSGYTMNIKKKSKGAPKIKTSYPGIRPYREPLTAQTTYAFQVMDIASRIYIADIPSGRQVDVDGVIQEAANLIKAGTVHFDKIDKQKADETVKQNQRTF